jgi:hypothetical protein
MMDEPIDDGLIIDLESMITTQINYVQALPNHHS